MNEAAGPVVEVADPLSSYRTQSATIISNNENEQKPPAGLHNQGQTATINVAIQLLYHIAALRKAVCDATATTTTTGPGVSTPASQLASNSSALKALSSVFKHLDSSSGLPVSTKPLTDSFGWGMGEVYEAQDLCEMMRALDDKLCRSENSTFEDKFKQLYTGKMASRLLPALNPPLNDPTYPRDAENMTNPRIETYYDISVHVRGFKSLQESLQDYIKESRWSDDDCGIQTIFRSFPPVLRISLTRVRYNVQTDRMDFVKDYLDYPEHLDMAPYMDDDAFVDSHEKRRQKYKLQAVAFYDGSGENGHYRIVIRPSLQPNDGTITSSSIASPQYSSAAAAAPRVALDQWYEFDDDRVTPVAPADVPAAVFQKGSPMSLATRRVIAPLTGKVEHWTKVAYVLQYVRISESQYHYELQQIQYQQEQQARNQSVNRSQSQPQDGLQHRSLQNQSHAVSPTTQAPIAQSSPAPTATATSEKPVSTADRGWGDVPAEIRGPEVAVAENRQNGHDVVQYDITSYSKNRPKKKKCVVL